jgi:hypothetical protein
MLDHHLFSNRAGRGLNLELAALKFVAVSGPVRPEGFRVTFKQGHQALNAQMFRCVYAYD